MKRSKARTEAREKRRAARKAGQKRPGGASTYARKRDWLLRASRIDENLGRALAKEHGHAYETERRLFGFDIPEPKPWRTA